MVSMKQRIVSASFLLFLLYNLLYVTVWARGGGGCLEQGTLVSTPTGVTHIEELHRGDVVWSNVTGKRKRSKVVAVTQVSPDHYLEVITSIGVLHITDEHLVAIRQGVFRKASNLKPDDTILYWNKNKNQWKTSTITAIHQLKNHKPAFNILVDHGGTYIANGILVHNKGCFLPDTPILRADGSSIAIQQVKPGDLVQAYNTDGRVATTTVRSIITHKVDEYYLVTTEQTVLNVTGEHPFFIGNGTFKTVENLKVGDAVYALHDGKLIPDQIKEIAKINRPTTVYNLQTDEPHTYFASGIAVHNKGGGCFPAGTLITTQKGLTPIELLAPGDFVTTFNKNHHEMEGHVKAVYATRSKVLVIHTNRGTLHTTAEHPLADQAGGFVLAKKVLPNDKLLYLQHNQFVPAIVKSVNDGNESMVFNLEVDAPHTYIADGFLVHNKGGGFRSSGGGSGSSCRPDDKLCNFLNLMAGLLFFGGYILYWIVGLFKKDENLDYVFPAMQFRKKMDKTNKLLDFLARQDKTMQASELQNITRSTFLKLQECWQSRDYDPMQSLLMPDLFEQHYSQIAGMIRNHEINKLDNLKIERIAIVNVRYTEKKEQREFTALVTATARDYYVDDRTGSFIRGDSSPATFQEFWTFQLQASGWMLREIEQTRESTILKDENFVEQFTDGQIEKIYGDKVDNLGAAGPWVEKPLQNKKMNAERMLNFLVQSDKLWDRQFMINTARRIFTDVHMSLEAGKIDEKTSSELFPDVLESMTARLKQWQSRGEAIEYRNFCVRKIELLLIRNYNDKSKNEYLARISAHAQRIHRINDQVVSDDGNVVPYEEYWTFGRLDNQWKLKEALPEAPNKKGIFTENVDEGSSANLIKWYYTKKRAM